MPNLAKAPKSKSARDELVVFMKTLTANLKQEDKILELSSGSEYCSKMVGNLNALRILGLPE